MSKECGKPLENENSKETFSPRTSGKEHSPAETFILAKGQLPWSGMACYDQMTRGNSTQVTTEFSGEFQYSILSTEKGVLVYYFLVIF